MDMCGVPEIIGHTWRMNDKSIVKVVFNGSGGEKRRRGRPKEKCNQYGTIVLKKTYINWAWVQNGNRSLYIDKDGEK